MIRPVLAVMAFVMAVSFIVTVVAAQNIFGTEVVSATVNIVIPPVREDVDGDGCVGARDLILVARNLGVDVPEGADVNGDGKVDIVDLSLVAASFGTLGSEPCP